MSEVSLLAHRVDGEGEPVLLLNGGMMSIAAWEPIARPLAESHRVLRCDFRGQALSPGVAHPHMEGNVADVAAVLDALDVERAHVVGASFGAEAALLLAALHPERVRSLVAVTATDVVTESMRRGGVRIREAIGEILAGEGDHGRFHDILVEDVFSDAWAREHRPEIAARRAQISQLPDPWFAGLLGLLDCVERVDLRPHLGAIRCPTLVVVAGDDRVMPLERSRSLAAAVAGAEVAEHPESGHALVAEDPGWLVERLLEFLGRHS